MTDCEHDHTPNATTEAAFHEADAAWGRRTVRALLAHSVHDREISDECIEAVAQAEEFLAADPERLAGQSIVHLMFVDEPDRWPEDSDQVGAS